MSDDKIAEVVMITLTIGVLIGICLGHMHINHPTFTHSLFRGLWLFLFGSFALIGLAVVFAVLFLGMR